MADELGWRPDVLVADYEMFGGTPLGFLAPQEAGGALPLSITMQTLRDLVVVGLHVLFLGLQIWLWAYWQKRGDKPVTDVVTSDYGRPLVRKG